MVSRRQRSGLDRNAEVDVFIALQEQRHRPGFVAAGMAAMVTTLKAVDRQDDAALELMDGFVLSHSEIGVGQYARPVSACKSMIATSWRCTWSTSLSPRSPTRIAKRPD